MSLGSRKFLGIRWPRDLVLRVVCYLMMFAVVIVTLYPVYWMVAGSLKSDNEFYTNIWGLPRDPQWGNYVEAWAKAGINKCFVNSVIVTVSTVFAVLIITSLAAYAFAKFDFPAKTGLFYFFLASMMIPSGMMIIPTFAVVNKLGLVNTRLSMVLVYTAGNVAFGIFLLRAYFVSIPSELEEAARIDGCTATGAFFRVILPLAKPGLATQLIYSGMNTWNEYFVGSILVRTRDLRTLPLGLVGFVEKYETHYPQYFAALCIITVPIIVLYVLGQKQFISGLTAGAVKG